MMNGKQVAFLTAMLEEATVTKAASAAGISRNTAYKYLNDPAFQKELNSRRTECITDVVRYLQGNLSKCAEWLMRIINDTDVGEQVKINAINTIFTSYKNLGETAELAMRIENIEAMLMKIEKEGE